MQTKDLTKQEIASVKPLGFLHNKGTRNFSGRVLTTNGKINAKQQICVGEAAEKFGNGNVTFTTRMSIEVQGIPYENIDAFREYLKKENLETGGTGAKVRPVVSCKGTTCVYGLIDTFAVSEQVHKKFFEGYSDVKLPHKFKIAVGGCPNNCTKPNLNDIGVIGQGIPVINTDNCRGCKVCVVENVCPVGAASVENKTLSIDREKCLNCSLCIRCPFDAVEERIQGYKIVIGGRWGKQISIGRPLKTIFFSVEEVLDIIEKSILLYKKEGKPGQRFAQLIDEIGFEETEQILLSNELLEEKEQILNS